MWSIIIYDKKKKKLIISRDRIGIKQLYYSQYNDNFIFSIPNSDKWQNAASQFGIDILDLGGSAGLA